MKAFESNHLRAEVHASPNFGHRKDGKRPSLLVLHYTGMETGEAAEGWLVNPASEVSAHYIVHEDGRIVQMVPESERAWHAGQSSWKGETDINSSSIGIEIVNGGPLLGFPEFAGQANRRRDRSVQGHYLPSWHQAGGCTRPIRILHLPARSIRGKVSVVCALQRGSRPLG